ncbi:hypothetical protein BGW36DRAFT_428711 [Talaromyces proteolyticus]|uniref:Uncharacterized protein n=1 Tax=Talaromyces proteolyticus TaxID=1131652 RepID=A0AAD4KNK3_9EURO|nr:uncharacterized protein BGW36DRAFT_428711 [Talaromyces proteolyticus]KAH8696718.1 hypothetical protein BGW36DRAFT_428711 [Talaromyces proteolyticus]
MAYTALQSPHQGNKFPGRCGGRHNSNANFCKHFNRRNKAHFSNEFVKDIDGNITMGGVESAASRPFPQGHQNPGPHRGNGRNRNNRKRNRHQKTGPRGPLPQQRRKGQAQNGAKSSHAPRELNFWEQVNWELKDTHMQDTPAPAEWTQFSYANTNWLQTQMDYDDDVVMGEAPSLTMSLLPEMMSLMSVRS